MEKSSIAGMIYLISCALHKIEPDERGLADMNFAEVYSLAEKHSLAALCWYGLGKGASAVPTELAAKWSMSLARSARKNLLMNGERGLFAEFCETEGIWNMPLKGSLLQKYYPAPGTREMADNDILFDGNLAHKVRDYFVGRGYQVQTYDLEVHDAYKKAPFYSFELHRVLYGEIYDEKLQNYYRDVYTRLIPDEGKKYAVHFSKEDFYIYVMSHAYKHFTGGGTGVRTLVDCYVLRHAEEYDREYLDGELAKMGILDFEHTAASLSEKLFADADNCLDGLEKLSAEDKKTLEIYVTACTYGTLERTVANRMHKIAPDEEEFSRAAKLRYIWKRLFPGEDHMRRWCKRYAPFLLRNKWLFHLSPIWRLLTKGLHGKKAVNELTILSEK